MSQDKDWLDGFVDRLGFWLDSFIEEDEHSKLATSFQEGTETKTETSGTEAI